MNPQVSAVPRPGNGLSGHTQTEVAVRGLICHSLCVRRVKGALEDVSGVQEVRFVPDPDRFEVTYADGATRVDELGKAVLGSVVMPRFREILEKFRRPLSSIRREVSKG